MIHYLVHNGRHSSDFVLNFCWCEGKTGKRVEHSHVFRQFGELFHSSTTALYTCLKVEYKKAQI